MAAAELFGCRFQVYRNGQIFYTFGQPPMPLKHLRFTGDEVAPPFLYEALFIFSYTCNLMEAFFKYISPTEKDALTEALNDFSQADLEELLSILTHLSILKGIGESLSGKTLEKILDDLQPKPRNITKFIQFPKSLSPIEMATSFHLLRFVRDIDRKEIGRFLRLYTGSDLFLPKTINVSSPYLQLCPGTGMQLQQYLTIQPGHSCRGSQLEYFGKFWAWLLQTLQNIIEQGLAMEELASSNASLMKMFEKKVQGFIDEVENNQIVWLQEIQEEAVKMFCRLSRTRRSTVSRSSVKVLSLNLINEELQKESLKVEDLEHSKPLKATLNENKASSVTKSCAKTLSEKKVVVEITLNDRLAAEIHQKNIDVHETIGNLEEMCPEDVSSDTERSTFESHRPSGQRSIAGHRSLLRIRKSLTRESMCRASQCSVHKKAMLKSSTSSSRNMSLVVETMFNPLSTLSYSSNFQSLYSLAGFKKKRKEHLKKVTEAREREEQKEKAKKRKIVQKFAQMKEKNDKEEEERKDLELLQKKREEEEQERVKKMAEVKRLKQIKQERQLAAEKKLQRKRVQERIRIKRYSVHEQEKKQRLLEKKKAIAVQMEVEKVAKKKALWEAAKEKERLQKEAEKSPQSYQVSIAHFDSENFVMDLNSDDSTDDESAPRKHIPSWAQGQKLNQAVVDHYYNPPDTDKRYGKIEPPNLEEIFCKSKPRYLKRTSSAVWHSPPKRTNLNSVSMMVTC
ncbi:INCE protein, partial [Polypterus senegalus]